MTDKVVEKRRVERKSDEALIRFEGDDFSIYSRVTDISDFGAFVATHYLLEPGTDILVSVFDADGSELSRKARVVHSNSCKLCDGKEILGLGIEFVRPGSGTIHDTP